MIINMRLHNEPFELIKDGSKVIELRINDEKRRSIKNGDLIYFTNRITAEIIKVKVTKLYLFNSFKEAYKSLNKVSLGFKENEEIDENDILKYYSKEEQEKYGVVAIEFILLN